MHMCSVHLFNASVIVILVVVVTELQQSMYPFHSFICMVVVSRWSSNIVMFTNSLKMKMAVIIGILEAPLSPRPDTLDPHSDALRAADDVWSFPQA